MAMGFGVLGLFVSFFMILLALVAVGASLGSSSSGSDDLQEEYIYGKDSADKTFASIKLSGIILGEPTSDDDFFTLFSDVGVVYGYDVKKQLRELSEDQDIDGIVLDIDSPGGTIFGSQAIADGISEYKQKTGKPVVAFVGGSAASGAYWAAAGADKIIADYGTLVGSIGVILGPFKEYGTVVSESAAFAGGVETTDGITTTFITAGEAKDLGNPYRKMTEKEQVLLQKMVDNSYSQFVSHVSKNRQIEESIIRNSIGAYVYDEKQAMDLGLIDSVGSREDAYLLLAEISNVEANNFNVVRTFSPSSFMDVLLGVFSPQPTPRSFSEHQLCTTGPKVLVLDVPSSQICN